MSYFNQQHGWERSAISLTHLGPSPPFWGLPEPGGPSSPRFWSPHWSGRGTHRSSAALRTPWSWIPRRPHLADTGDELWMLVRRNKRYTTCCRVCWVIYKAYGFFHRKTWNPFHSSLSNVWHIFPVDASYCQHARKDKIESAAETEMCGYAFIVCIVLGLNIVFINGITNVARLSIDDRSQKMLLQWSRWIQKCNKNPTRIRG